MIAASADGAPGGECADLDDDAAVLQATHAVFAEVAGTKGPQCPVRANAKGVIKDLLKNNLYNS